MTLSFWHWERNLGVLFKSLYEKVKSFASFASCLSPVRFKTTTTTTKKSRLNVCSPQSVTARTLSWGLKLRLLLPFYLDTETTR